MRRPLFRFSLFLAVALSAACVGGQSGTDGSYAWQPCLDPALGRETIDPSTPPFEAPVFIERFEHRFAESEPQLEWSDPLTGSASLELSVLEHGSRLRLGKDNGLFCPGGGAGTPVTVSLRSSDGILDLELRGIVLQLSTLSLRVEIDAEALAQSELADVLRGARPALFERRRPVGLALVWYERLSPAEGEGWLELTGTARGSVRIARIGSR